MELGTFGAILTFALELEGKITRFFGAAAEAVSKGETGELFSVFAAEGEKRIKLLERSRRECVAEMILEPITGFRSEDYLVQVEVPAGASGADWVKQALAIEEVAGKFYETASQKVSVPEVSRTLKKIAKQHAEQKETLAGLSN